MEIKKLDSLTNHNRTRTEASIQIVLEKYMRIDYENTALRSFCLRIP